MDNNNYNNNLSSQSKVTQDAKPTKGKPLIDFTAIYTTLVLNWKWFIVSISICLLAAWLKLRYTTPLYQATEKLMITGDGSNSYANNGASAGLSSLSTGTLSMSSGLGNEIEILRTHSLSAQVVRDLKLYTTYYSVGKMKDILMYKTQPISADMDPGQLEKLQGSISLLIERKGNKYAISGNCISNITTSLPTTLNTSKGSVLLTPTNISQLGNGGKIRIIIVSPLSASGEFVSKLSMLPQGKTTNILNITMTDVSQERAVDYLKQLAICYNRQSNNDKNDLAKRTEQFINGRIEKINTELGSTEGQIERYKRSRGMIDQATTAGNAFNQATSLEQRIDEMGTQMALMDEMRSVVNNPHNKYQLLPANIGISNGGVSGLINNYNSIVQKRSLLLQSASETSPSVIPLTTQLDQLKSAINHAMDQAERVMNIQRNALAVRHGRFQGEVSESPEEERTLNQIGRQQEVKSSLYIMLLQKREENSISLAATADKARLLDDPAALGKVSPNNKNVMMLGAIVGFGIPFLILMVLQFFHYKIESRDDVERGTKLPILADVAVASNEIKKNGEIVVQENRNNMMEEIFRSIRTNILFMLEGDEKVILCTSSIAGEGKSFISSNLAMSLSVLGKKVLLVGLDIRKPRLHHIFNIDKHKGLTNLLTKANPTWEEIETQIMPSGVNDNLCIMPSGPIPPNPTEMVARQSLDIIFKALRDNFDYIVIDSAPIGMVTDTLEIARVADMTAYVCKADFTPKSSLQMVNELAQNKKLPKIGIVINGIDLSKRKYGYYYGYGRYGKYGRYGHYGKTYGHYGTYSSYYKSYGDKKKDNSIKR